MAADHTADEAVDGVSYPTDTEILITRVFDAPKELIYRAWTTPELVRRWWCGDRGTITAADMDVRVGGSWRFVLVTGDGTEYAFHGTYREIVPQERVVYTEVFEDLPAAEAQTTVTFDEVDGRTTLAVRIRYGSRQQRDAHRRYMTDGLREALDRLERTAQSATSSRPPERPVPAGTAPDADRVADRVPEQTGGRW